MDFPIAKRCIRSFTGGSGTGEQGQVGADAGHRSRPARALENFSWQFARECSVETLTMGPPVAKLRWEHGWSILISAAQSVHIALRQPGILRDVRPRLQFAAVPHE